MPMVKRKKKKHPLKELWGAIKFTKPTEVLLKEARRELDGKWFRQPSQKDRVK